MKSITIAKIFLIILIAILGYTTYIKITYTKDTTIIDNNINTNIVSLATIENNYNNSTNTIELKKRGITTLAIIENNNLKITYNYIDTSDITKNYSYTYIFTFTNGILKYTANISDDKLELDTLKTIFINLSDAVSVSQGNEKNASLLTILSVINGKEVSDTFKIIITDTDITYVIDTTKQIVLNTPSIKYQETTILNIDTFNYSIDMNNTTLDIISLDYIEKDDFVGYSLNAYLKDSNNVGNIVLKIYNKEKVELTSQTLNLSELNAMEEIELNIKLDDKINKEDVIYYSVEIKEND